MIEIMAWLRAPNRNASNKNVESRWLGNGSNGGGVWTSSGGGSSSATAAYGGGVNFMEVDGVLR